MSDPIVAARAVCTGISYQLGVARYFDASDYLRTDYIRGYVAATLADALEADAAEIVSLQDLNAALAGEAGKLWAENQRLRKIIDKMDQHSPRADHTCDEPGITLSEAVMREWPELAEPNDEVSE